MSSLSQCLKKAGKLLPDADHSAILSRAKALRDEGVASAEASRRAVDEPLSGVRQQITDFKPPAKLSRAPQKHRADLPPEMAERGVTMFDGLRTKEGEDIARAFIANFHEAEKPADDAFAGLFGFNTGTPSYHDKIDSARYQTRQAVVSAISEYKDGGQITPKKALFIADLMQMASAITNVSEKVYALMPDAFKNSDLAQEDFGTVSQERSFDPIGAYKKPYAKGVDEFYVNGADPIASVKSLADLDVSTGSSFKSTPVTNTEFAERFLQDPTALIRQLVDISDFVRTSNEAAYMNFIENYSPKLLAEERAKEAKRLADYVIANAAIGKPAPKLSRPAQNITIEHDESGNPTYTNKAVGITLNYPQVTERLEVIEQTGEQVLNYAIMPTEGFDNFGMVELWMKDGKPISLLDIEINDDARKQGIARKVVETLLAANPDVTLNISNIVPKAQGFWEKMGIPIPNLEAGAAYEGNLNWKDYQAATNGRTAESATGASEPAGQERNAGAAGGVQGADAASEVAKPEPAAPAVSPKVSPERAREIVSALGNDIEVVNSVSDIPADDRKAIISAAPDGSVRGAFVGGKVYVVLENIASEEELAFVAAHEGFHRGLVATIPEAGRLLKAMYLTNGKLRAATDAQMQAHKIGQAEAIEEALADLAGKREARDLKGWDKLAKLVRDFLTGLTDKLGIKLQWTDDMIADFVAGTARAGLRGASVDVGKGAGLSPRLSRASVNRRDMMLALAAAVAPSSGHASVTLGKAQPVSADVFKGALSPAIQNALRGKGNGITELNGAQVIKQALLDIGAAGPEPLRALARQVAGLMPDKGVLLTVLGGRWNAHGAVSAGPEGPHMKLMAGDGHTGLTYGTFIHEAMHVAVLARYSSLSRGLLRSNDAKLGMSAPAAAAKMAQFRAVWDEFEAATKANPPKDVDTKLSVDEAAGSPDEFFVRALTDPLLQRYMAGIKYDGKTLLERFKDWVRGLFIKDGVEASWLDAALVASQELADSMAGDRADFARMRRLSDISTNREAAMLSRTPGGLVDRVMSAGGGKKIVGQTSRQYTDRQLRGMSNVGFQTEQPTLEERAKAIWQDLGKRMAQGIADQFAPVKDLSSAAYTLLRLSKGASGAFEVLLQGGKLKLNEGVYDFDPTDRGGVLKSLLKPLQGEHHDFFRWIAANRAERLKGEGKENLFSDQDIADIKTLADGVAPFDFTLQHGANAGTTTRDRSLIYSDSLKTFNEFNKNVLDMAEQSGLIDGESRAIWEHEFYVPFYRVEDESGIVGGANVKSGVVRQQAFKALKGGKQALNADLLDNTLMNWAHLLDASAKNRAAKATLEAAEAMGQAIPAPEATAREMANSIGKKDGVVWFMDQGQKRFYTIEDKYLLTAISALEYAGMRNPVMNAMGTFKRALTIGVTASPFFRVRNLIRDSVQAIGTAPLSYNPAANLAEGWRLTDPKSDAYFRLLAGGGTIHFGTMMEGNEAKRVQALVESGVRDSTILNTDKKMKMFYRRFIEPSITAYNELGNRGEAINRAALYAQLTKQGVGHAQASLMARDLMDFSMQGSFTSIRFLTQVVPFMNARIQGLYKLGKAAKEDPARFGAVLGATALMSIGLLMAFSDDDDWKKRTDADRNNWWWFKFGGTAFRLPKPFEIGAIATLAERGFELAFDKEMTGKRFRQNVLALVGDNLSMNPIPQLVKPMLDIYANKNSFTGAPIETQSMEKLRAAYRFTDRTSMAARGASTAANAVTGLIGVSAPSPVQIDHLLQGYFGWLGTFVVQAGDVLARPLTGQPVQASSDILKAATGGMLSDLRDAPSRYVNQLYTQAVEIDQAYGTWRALLKEGKTAEAAAFREDNAAEIGKERLVSHAKLAEAKINQQIRQVERGEMSADDKRARIRELTARKEQVAKPLAEVL